MAQSPALKNLLRRVRRFNLSNPTAQINVESVKAAGNNTVKLSRIGSQLDKLQAVQKLNKRIQTAATKVNEKRYQGHIYESVAKNKFKPFKAKTPKTVKAAEKELARVKGELKKATSFRNRQDKFVEAAAEYNDKLSKRKNSLRFSYIPRNENQLRKAKKALKLLKQENPDVSAAKAIMGIPEGHELRRAVMEQDIANAGKVGGYTFRFRRFYQTALQNTRSSPVPELRQLFIDGGESMLEDLEAAGFTMEEWYKPDTEIDEPEIVILDKLEDAMKSMSGRNLAIAQRFLDSMRLKYK